jgi:hypothetical protein
MAGNLDRHHVGYLLEGGPTGLDDTFKPVSTVGWGERYESTIKGSQART